MERRLAAILLTDMVGYSRLMGLDEEGTIARQKAHREEIIDPNLSAHGGRIVKTTGDGLLVEFPSVVDAVKCAVEVQEVMAGRDTDVPDDRRIQYRIGINLGDIVIDGDDILGDGVNVAARLEGLAKPGGVCISGTVYDQLAGKVDFDFEDAGEQAIKNVPRPVRVWHWHTGQDVRRSNDVSEPPALPNKPSIAVLPFDNMSGDPEQEYFADGMTEDIITELSRFEDLFVISRNSSFAYKAQQTDAKAVAHELGVHFILEGSVRKAGQRVRITAQLINGQDGGHVWAERYDGALEDVFDLQEQVTSQVVGSIWPQITGELSWSESDVAKVLLVPPMNLHGRRWKLRELQDAIATPPCMTAPSPWPLMQLTSIPSAALPIRQYVTSSPCKVSSAGEITPLKRLIWQKNGPRSSYLSCRIPTWRITAGRWRGSRRTNTRKPIATSSTPTK